MIYKLNYKEALKIEGQEFELYFCYFCNKECLSMKRDMFFLYLKKDNDLVYHGKTCSEECFNLEVLRHYV